MPIVEFVCPKCREQFERILSPNAPISTRCDCGNSEVYKMVSLPGYRRDHTVYND